MSTYYEPGVKFNKTIGKFVVGPNEFECLEFANIYSYNFRYRGPAVADTVIRTLRNKLSKTNKAMALATAASTAYSVANFNPIAIAGVFADVGGFFLDSFRDTNQTTNPYIPGIGFNDGMDTKNYCEFIWASWAKRPDHRPIYQAIKY